MLKRSVKCLCLILGVMLLLLSTASCKAIEKCFYPLEYEEYIYKYGDMYDIPYDLLAAVIKAESGFDPAAVSGAGAVGLMQLLPATAEEIALRLEIEYDEDMLWNPETNISYGSYYLAYLYENLGSNWKTACAAYNAGIGRVKGWLEDAAYSDDGKNLKYIPFEETRNYLERIEKNRNKYTKLYFS